MNPNRGLDAYAPGISANSGGVCQNTDGSVVPGGCMGPDGKCWPGGYCSLSESSKSTAFIPIGIAASAVGAAIYLRSKGRINDVALGAVIGAAGGGVIAGPVGVAVGTGAGAFVGKAFSWIKSKHINVGAVVRKIAEELNTPPEPTTEPETPPISPVTRASIVSGTIGFLAGVLIGFSPVIFSSSINTFYQK